MELICLGLSHRTAPVEVREQFALPEKDLPLSIQRLKSTPGVHEAVIISTCNRVELYLAVERAAAAFEALGELLSSRGASPHGGHFQHQTTDNAVRHLFRVVSGLDSMVLGETEIFGQVKKAYAIAAESGGTSRYLNKLFQRAFNVGKEVRTRTNISRGNISVGSAAMELAERIFGGLENCKVMILGAGETSELTARALQARGVSTIFVANRSHSRALSLAEKMGGTAIHFEQWGDNFKEVDILIGSTAAPHPIVTAARLAALMRLRADRPLFCIDLAVPRDIEAAVNDLEGVYLYDIDSLQEIADRSMTERRLELTGCEEMIERHARSFSEWLATASGSNAHNAVRTKLPEGAKS